MSNYKQKSIVSKIGICDLFGICILHLGIYSLRKIKNLQPFS